jgi:hypothetical protein
MNQNNQNLTSNNVRTFKKALIQFITKDSNDISADITEYGRKLIRVMMFKFQTSVADLEVPSLGLTYDSIKSELSTSLETILTEFPESTSAKLVAIKKIQKKVSAPKKKGGRTVNVALSIVGMLRPPGYGNLQGFANYATAISGLPVDFLFGMQNDGDSPEVSPSPGHLYICSFIVVWYLIADHRRRQRVPISQITT